jgi:hypothetical protein
MIMDLKHLKKKLMKKQEGQKYIQRNQKNVK